MNFEASAADHVNRRSFRGVLTLVNIASDKAPAGARGHRVLLTRRAAENAMPSLMGMALDYSPALDRHDARRKVGIITSAEIVGNELQIGGFLYARDFPEIVEEVRKKKLGCSYEITDALVSDIRAAVWVLTKVTFTGAAVLRRDKAAYAETWVELGPSSSELS
jgi:hypothetical protein